MGTRYDDQRYLDEWRQDGVYPKIHDKVFEAVRQEFPEPTRDLKFLDLCCSTGLLGAHLREYGFSVCFADGDRDAVRRGIEAGTFGMDKLWFGDIDATSIHQLGAWMAEQGVTEVMARRCLCVLSNVVDLDVVGTVFAEAGVRRLVLEGQLISKRAVQPNGAGEDQAKGLESSGRWRIVTRVNKEIFYLEAV